MLRQIKRRTITSFFLLLFILLSVGCGPQHEQIIDELAIILGLGIDVDLDDTDIYLLTTTKPTFTERAKEPVTETTVKGYTLDGALRNWEYQRQSKIGLGKVSTVIYGQNIMDRGLREISLDLRQIVDMNILSNVVYFPGKPQDAWAIDPPEESRKAVYLMNLLEMVREEGLMPMVNLCELNTNIMMEDRDGFLPRVELTKDGKSLHVTGLAILDKQGKLVTVLNDAEMLTFLKLYDKAIGAFDTTKIIFEEQEGFISYVIKKQRRTKINVDIVEGKPKIRILVPLDVEIRSLKMQGVDILSREFITAMEDQIASELTEKSQELIEKLQGYETDPLGLGQWVRIRQKNYYNQGSWRDDYPNADIRCNYEVRVRRLNIIKEE